MEKNKMVTVTVNIDAKLDKVFRQVAASQYGRRKGSLGKAVSDAFSAWVKMHKRTPAEEFAMKMLEKGYDLGGLTYTHRSELYDR